MKKKKSIEQPKMLIQTTQIKTRHSIHSMWVLQLNNFRIFAHFHAHHTMVKWTTQKFNFKLYLMVELFALCRTIFFNQTFLVFIFLCCRSVLFISHFHWYPTHTHTPAHHPWLYFVIENDCEFPEKSFFFSMSHIPMKKFTPCVCALYRMHNCYLNNNIESVTSGKCIFVFYLSNTLRMGRREEEEEEDDRRRWRKKANPNWIYVRIICAEWRSGMSDWLFVIKRRKYIRWCI